MFLDMSPFRRNHNFRLLFLAQLISGFGSQMTLISVPFQIYHLTNSMFLTGLIGSVELVALALTVLYGGVLSDRYDRRRIMIVCESLMILGVALLAWNATLVSPNLYLIFGCAAFLSAFNGLHRPAIEALLPALVQEKELAAVSSLGPLRTIITAVAGPSVAGLILASFGPMWTYIADGATFVASIGLIALIHMPVRAVIEEKARASFWSEVREGVRYVRGRRDLIGTYLIDFFAMVFVSPQVLMPHIAKTLSAEASVGLLYASPSMGALIAAVLSGWTQKINRHGLAIIFAAIAWAATVAAVGIATGINAILFFLFLSGAFDMISGIFRMNIWNKTIPSSIRGRMASFEMLSYMSGPLLGQLFIGSMADQLGYQHALLLGGGIAIILIVIASSRLPEFVRYRDAGGK